MALKILLDSPSGASAEYHRIDYATYVKNGGGLEAVSVSSYHNAAAAAANKPPLRTQTYMLPKGSVQENYISLKGHPDFFGAQDA